MIRIEHLTKTFLIPHDRTSSFKEHFLKSLKREVTYEEFHALENISFSVEKGDFIGIIGANGSGKTVLLKILAHVLIPSSGTVRVRGSVVPFLALGVGFHPDLTARDNVFLYATLMGMTKKEIDALFDSIIAFSELEKFIDTKLRNYSTGMQMRLAFSTAIQFKGDIFLMDEGLAVGDVRFQEKCYKVFENFKAQGQTILYVSHSTQDIQRFCDKTLVLNQGQQQFFGETSQAIDIYLGKKKI